MSVVRDALGGKARQVIGAAGLRPGARKPLAAERLHADHGADLVAVDVEIADAGVLGDVIGDAVDAAVQAERQPIAGGVDAPR